MPTDHLPNTTAPRRVTALSALFVCAFLGLFFVDSALFSRWIDQSFNWSAQYFGLFWQLLMIANFAVAIFLATRPYARFKLGGRDTPEFPAFQWVAMVLCTLLAGGGVFWAAAEPIAHFVTVPPVFTDIAPGTSEAVPVALAQSFLHWGFLAWSILGSLTALVLMRLHYDLGLPLAPRTLLYPLLGEQGVRGPIGDIADVVSILAVFAGTVGPIGFLGLQISYGLSSLYNTPDSTTIQLITIAGLMVIYLTSAVSGMHRGIQILSRLNIVLGAALLLFLLLAGPTAFIFQGFFEGLLSHLQWLPEQALYRGEAGWFNDPGWLSYWTIFFWGWFIGYGPMMAIFIARISRGRSAREIIILMSVVAPLVTMAWFSILGGTGLGLEMANTGTVTEPFEGFNLPAVLLAITQSMPFNTVVSFLFLILTALFVATTGDSMTYSLSVVSAGHDDPPRSLRLFWGLTLGVTAMILVGGPDGGVGKLQNFIVVTAVPVSLLLLPSLWGVFPLLKRSQ
ncbi:MAG: BCCT family transporter [Luminiphilus sp.]|nr:BCCT family transporter [Luminiphilus sp.]